MSPSRSAFPAARAIPLAVCLAVLPGIGRGAPESRNELGRPVLRHYTPGEHLRHMSSDVVTQDATGLMYFANGGDLLTYDGARWGFIRLPTESAAVRQFAITDNGTIYLGGAGVLGYLRGTGPAAEFVSLAGQLPAGARNVDAIEHAVAIGSTVCFSDEEKILIWRDGRFTVVPFPTPAHSHGARLHRIGGALYVTATGHGLGRLVNDAVATVADDPVLRENQIISVEAGADGAFVLLTAERGFFQLGPDGRAAPLPTEANRWLAGRRIFRALRLADGSRVVAFSAASGDGGMRFASDGHYVGPIDTSIGLYVKAVRDFFCDREGGLWLGLDTGSARLEWPSAVTAFDVVNGLGQGAVADVVRHDGVLFAATGEGLFRLEPLDGAGRVAHFERILNQPVGSLVSHPAGLLALGYGGLLAQTPAGFVQIARLPDGGECLLRSKRDPDLVWIGTAQGLRSVRHGPQGWSDEGPLAGFAENCRSLSESADGALWVATAGRGFFRLSFGAENRTAPQIERFAGGNGLPGQLGRSAVTEGEGGPIFTAGTTPGLFRHESAGRRFVPVAGLSAWPAEIPAEGWTVGSGHEAFWLAGPAGIDRLTRDGGETQRLPHLVLATVGAVQCLREEATPDGAVLWVCGSKGLARVEVARAFTAAVPFATAFTASPLRDGARLPPEHPALTFSYLAPRQRPTSPVAYQTRLVGWDRDWSESSAKRERTYAHLPSGAYRFEVRARDAAGEVSASAALGFVVLPPWWATWPAILGYVAAGLGLLAGMVQVRTRGLLRRAGQLEAVVAERTLELTQKNTELVRLHQLELDEKISARLAEEKARLEVLRYQLNPHFLFNTLASISAALPTGRSTPRVMVERLAEFCRLTLHRTDERDWTTLGEELRLLRAYLEIEQSRWGELLDVEISADAALDGEPLPHFLLLPLVL